MARVANSNREESFQTLPEGSALDDPDVAIMAWLDHEEAMFRRLESRVVAERLSVCRMVGSEQSG